MISLILPYWERQASADRGLKSIERCYPGLDLEVVVVDDGSRTPFRIPDVSLDIRVLTLPGKDEPKSPVTPWNAGVRWASGDIIALSCIEVVHEEPVLEQLVGCLETPLHYALASAWCPESGEWHCHSSRKIEFCPPGVGLSFLGVMYRSLYESVGGFDETFRDGAGWEDRDFINRLHEAGARFVIRNDLRVIHPKTDASINWGANKFARNRKIFEDRWLT